MANYDPIIKVLEPWVTIRKESEDQRALLQSAENILDELCKMLRLIEPSVHEDGPTLCMCSRCGDITECTYDADPFAYEIHGDREPVWQCDYCNGQSASDI